MLILFSYESLANYMPSSKNDTKKEKEARPKTMGMAVPKQHIR